MADLQQQIYILSAVFGGVCGVLIVVTIYLVFFVIRLRRKVGRLGSRLLQTSSPDEITRRGYAAYSGKATSNNTAGRFDSGQPGLSYTAVQHGQLSSTHHPRSLPPPTGGYNNSGYKL